MSLIFPDGSYTVNTRPGGSQPFGQPQQGGRVTKPASGWASPAQPREQSFGTPYGGASGFDAYKPPQTSGGAAQTPWFDAYKPPQTSGGAAQTPWGDRWYSSSPGQQTYGDPRGGYAATPGNRPPPFQMSPAQTPWGQSMDPFAERDAFVNQINQQRNQRQMDFNNNGSIPPPTWGGMPNINQQQAMADAGLSMGAPSMNPEYGDSLIFRLNDQYGGPSRPVSRHWTDNPANQRPQVPAGWENIKGADKYASNYSVGSDDWLNERNSRAAAAQAADRPVAIPSRPRPASFRQPVPPASPRAAADAVIAAGGDRDAANRAWREAHRANVASPASQRWLASQTPANRSIYQMLSRY